MKKRTKKIAKASVLVATMIILGIILVIVLNETAMTLLETKASLGEDKSSKAIQNSQTGMETVLDQISRKGSSYITELNGVAGLTCNSSSKLLENNAKGFKLELRDSGGLKIDCDNASVKMGQVAKVKSVGSETEKHRATEAVPPCYGSLTTDGLIGYWKFDGNYIDSTGANNAVACDAGNYFYDHPDPNGSPSFLNEGGRRFIRLNDGNRSCARVSHIPAYQLQEGTISFWMRSRAPLNPATQMNIFVKDAHMCNTNSDPNLTGESIPGDNCTVKVGNRNNCDCGHFGFRFNWGLSPNNFGVRWQNDGNGFHYALSNDLSKVSLANWTNQWHLVTITFNSDEYILYVDGIEHSNFLRTDPLDPDSRLEALTRNDYHIWLGAGYPHDWISWFDGRVDMDDLRIYSKPLKQCEVVALCQNT